MQYAYWYIHGSIPWLHTHSPSHLHINFGSRFLSTHVTLETPWFFGFFHVSLPAGLFTTAPLAVFSLRYNFPGLHFCCIASPQSFRLTTRLSIVVITTSLCVSCDRFVTRSSDQSGSYSFASDAYVRILGIHPALLIAGFLFSISYRKPSSGLLLSLERCCVSLAIDL